MKKKIKKFYFQPKLIIIIKYCQPNLNILRAYNLINHKKSKFNILLKNTC